MAGYSVLRDMTPRLQAAAADVAEAERLYREALRRRDELVVTAWDGGYLSQRQIARCAHVSVTRVSGILLDAGA